DDAGKSIYRLRTDGSGNAKLMAGENMSYAGGNLYFVQPDGRNTTEYALYRISSDGSGLTRVSLLVDNVRGLEAFGDRIYYNIYGSSEQFSMRSDGSDWRRGDGKPIYLSTAKQFLEARQKKIAYSVDPKNDRARKADIAVGKALAILPTIVRPGMSDDEKLKAIHDYIVLNTAYDYDNYLKDTIPVDSYSEYGVLNNGVAVCNGYALAMKLLLDAAGVESYYVAGEVISDNKETGQKKSEGHAWNVVKIGDRYYQVDATWDDPVPNQAGYVRYDYFKVTDEFMKQSRNWDAGQAPAAL
ncbi:MAG: DUF5050 domain-containing protein, partial [Cohnella sp.]|nr:DUF5050 domain-containing protein [Cohnella sp.]